MFALILKSIKQIRQHNSILVKDMNNKTNQNSCNLNICLKAFWCTLHINTHTQREREIIHISMTDKSLTNINSEPTKDVFSGISVGPDPLFGFDNTTDIARLVKVVYH